MTSGNRITRQLPQGIIDSANYEIHLHECLQCSCFQLAPTQSQAFMTLCKIDSLGEWLGLIDSRHHKHFLSNIEQAQSDDANYLISAYCINLGNDETYWVIDYAECYGNTQLSICGTIFIAEAIEDVARLMKDIVTR